MLFARNIAKKRRRSRRSEIHIICNNFLWDNFSQHPSRSVHLRTFYEEEHTNMGMYIYHIWNMSRPHCLFSEFVDGYVIGHTRFIVIYAHAIVHSVKVMILMCACLMAYQNDSCPFPFIPIRACESDSKHKPFATTVALSPGHRRGHQVAVVGSVDCEQPELCYWVFRGFCPYPLSS